MGYGITADLAHQVTLGNLSLDLAIEYHLTVNHFPALTRGFVETAKAAIEAAQRDEWDADIKLPEGIYFSHRTKSPTAPAKVLVEALRLEPFVATATEAEGVD